MITSWWVEPIYWASPNARPQQSTSWIQDVNIKTWPVCIPFTFTRLCQLILCKTHAMSTEMIIKYSIEANKTLLKPVVRVLLPTEPSCFPSPSKAEVHQPSFPIEPSCSRAAVNCPFSQASFRCPLSWVNFHCPSEVSGLSLILS